MSDALFTDLYELTMMAGYFDSGRTEDRATFDLYFRHPPAGVDLVVACGLSPALDFLASLEFTAEDLDYLGGLNLFREDFLAYLASLRFTGDVWGVPEGTAVFSDEPLLRVTAPLAQAQLVETALLNQVCYSSLVASNASQLTAAARGKDILEFGARRAHGPNGALTGARAAIIGGCAATSNTRAGQLFGVPVSGTQAHAWIMAFDDELESFRAYAKAFPDACVLLVDTYDTLASGVPHAITVAKELAAAGSALQGIRLDSGDLGALATEARRMLDDAGFEHVSILASGDLDAVRIAELERDAAPINGYGVGTSLLTARQDPALSGVYKLAEINGHPVMKVSSSAAKTTSPGCKQVWRHDDGDVLGLADEQRDGQPLLVEAMRDGQRVLPRQEITTIRDERAGDVAAIREKVVGGTWTVQRSSRLETLRSETLQRLRSKSG